MQRIEWSSHDSTGFLLNFQWIDFGSQVLVWVSDGASFDSLSAAVPGEPFPPVTTLLSSNTSSKGSSIASRLSTFLISSLK
jgi:hypothetical protein